MLKGILVWTVKLANVVDGGGHNVSPLQIDDDDVIMLYVCC